MKIIVIPNLEYVKEVLATLIERYEIDIIIYDFDGNELNLHKKGT